MLGMVEDDGEEKDQGQGESAEPKSLRKGGQIFVLKPNLSTLDALASVMYSTYVPVLLCRLICSKLYKNYSQFKFSFTNGLMMNFLMVNFFSILCCLLLTFFKE